MKNWFRSAAILLGACILTTGCTAVPTQAENPSASSQSSSSTQELFPTGKLVIGIDDTFAPMGYRDEAGKLVGFDIDLAKAVCELLDVTPEFKTIDWAAKELALESGTVDCIWNGLSVTPQRKSAMSLSQPYLNNKIIIMGKEGLSVSNVAELASYRVGVQAGSAALDAIRVNEAYASISSQITEYPTYDEAILDLQAGRLDFIVIDEVYGNYKNQQLEQPLTISPVHFGDDFYAIGFRKQDVALTQAVNHALKLTIEQGLAAEISIEWFGENLILQP